MQKSYCLSDDNIELNYFTSCEDCKSLCGDHCHDRYEITYTVSPSGRYIVEGSEHKVVCGTVMLIAPMRYHHVSLDESDAAEIYTLYFDKSILSPTILSMLEKITKDEEERGRVYSYDIVSPELIFAFERFKLINSLPATEGKAYMHNLLSEILILLSATEGVSMHHNENELGARVAKYINLSLEKNICLDKLAQKFFVSKYHLCRAFKTYSGTTVHAYINHKRILHAKRLIESGMTASHVAERVGFGDYSAFYRAYLKVVGKSPTAE